MSIQKIKAKVAMILPNSWRIRIKNLYYDGVLFSQSIKQKFYSGYFDFFEGIVIDTTTYCNLRCPNCPNSKYERSLLKNKRLMSEEVFKKIIDELAELNFHGMIFPNFYGEPLGDERIVDFISYISEKIPGSKVILNSNGFLLTIPLYKRLVRAGVKKVTLTQYGKVIPRSVTELLNHLKNNPQEKNIISYRILNEDSALSNIGGEVKVKNLLDRERPNCTYYKYVTIDYEGKVILCCSDYHSSITFGNIRNEKLIDIWNKSKYKKIRKDILRKKYKLLICRKCVGLKE